MSEVQQIIGTIYIGVGTGALVFLSTAIRNQEAAGSRSFAVFVVAVATYAISSGLDLFTANYAFSMLAQSVTNCAGVLIGISWLLLAVEVSERQRVTRWITAGSAAYILIAWLFALINPGGLVLNPTTVVGTQLELNPDIGFWLLLGMAWIQVFTGVGLLVVEILDSTGLRQKQLVLLTLAIIPALVASIATALAQTRPVVGYDYTVFGWIGTMLLFAVALYSGRFLRLDTVARQTVVEEMSDAMVVLDSQQHVVDANARAESMFNVTSKYVGLSAAEFFDGLPSEAREQLLSGSSVDTELSSSTGGNRMHISASCSTIDQTGRNGQVLVFRDITERYQQREQIRRERDLKKTIRDILVQLSSKREIEQAFCDRLLSNRKYSEVWIGGWSGNDDDIVPRAYSGDKDDAEGSKNTEIASSRAARVAKEALETNEIIVDRKRATNTSDSDAGRDSQTGEQTVAASPLSYNDLIYGVLVVSTPQADGLDSDDRQSLSELGESIAFAINAAEQQEALRAEKIRQIVIQLRDPSHHFVSVTNNTKDKAKRIETPIEVHEVRNSDAVGEPNDSETANRDCLQFLTTSVGSADSFAEQFADHTDIKSVSVLTENESSASLRLRVNPPTVRALLADVGGKVRTFHITNGCVEIVAEFSLETDLDRVLAHLNEHYQKVNILSITTESRDSMLSDIAILESLTDKQREALEVAYHSGFFDRPQRQTAEEVAQELGITRPTFLSHVRAAEHEVLGAVVTQSYK